MLSNCSASQSMVLCFAVFPERWWIDEAFAAEATGARRLDLRCAALCNVAAGSDLPMIAYLAEANEVREGDGHWECWDEDEPCDSGGSCGKCVVKVLSGADHLSPQTPREQHTIAKLNQQAFDGQLEEARCRLSCQARCRGAVEIERVEIERAEVLAARPHTDKMDERTLLQGLIVMFQRALSASIKRELYGCAQRLANKLNLKPVRSCGVIPDFCKGDAILSHYFQIVEELRHVCWRKRVQAMPDFQRIEAVMREVDGEPVPRSLHHMVAAVPGAAGAVADDARRISGEHAAMMPVAVV